MKLKKIATGVVLSSIAFFAAASINVSPILLDVDNKSSNDFIHVKNTGTTTEYVEVRAEQLLNPGQANEKLVAITNPHQAGLLVTPAKLVIEPGAERLVKLSLLNSPAAVDSIYRVVITPKANQELIAKGQGRNIGVQVSVSYDALVIQRAKNAKPNVSAVRDGKTVKVTNNGNSSVLLYGAKQCVKGTCTTLPVERLYAKSTLTLKLTEAAPISFEQEFVDQHTEIRSN